jgi:hypothetical protein
MRSKNEFEQALALLQQGLTASEVARATGIPRSTVRDWGYGRGTRQSRARACTGHDFSSLDESAYAYLLGIYLGDGYLCPRPRGVWQLRITLDSAYPGIVRECLSAVEAIAPGKAYVLRRRHDRAVEVSKYWKHWTCLIPQHGPGPKHTRSIVLTGWQWRIVAAHVEPFLRGLIHSDGTRIVATERKRRYVRRAPRYAFKNRSEDILQLFGAACGVAGVHFTRASPTQIAVYRKDSVAILDRFIGPKR